MSTHYKYVINGYGTVLCVDEETYISIGKKGENVTIRAKGKVIAFSSINNLVDALDPDKATFYRDDNRETHGRFTEINEYKDSEEGRLGG